MNNLPKPNPVKLMEHRNQTRQERLTFPNQFKFYLLQQKISDKTIRNYLSDLSHFVGWALLQLKTSNLQISQADEIASHFTVELVQNYKRFLVANHIPTRTANRRLSTVRQLGKFLVAVGEFAENPAGQIPNITINQEYHQTLIKDFKYYLEGEGVTPKTIKNYISDVRGFLKFTTTLELKI